MITPKTVFQFLLGNRSAIEKIAGNKWSLLLGLLFIVSAGLARNYDHHILTRELLWIGGPVGMSLFSSVFIYGFIKIFGRLESEKAFQNYLPFLRCFVMTAPMAWLYGIPFELFSTPLKSAVYNFNILLLVSIWRVVLMSRVIFVLFNFTPQRAFALVMIPASSEMFFASIYKSFNVVGIMGGMRLSPADSFIVSASQTMTIGAAVMFLISFCVGFTAQRGDINPWKQRLKTNIITLHAWFIAILVIGLWSVMSLQPQKQLKTRQKLRELIRHDQYSEAAAFLKDKSRSDFPRHQLLFSNSGSLFRPPSSMDVLVAYNQWPDWMKEELLDDVQWWVKESNYPEKEHLYETLYQHYSNAPFVQEIADILTPGINASDYFPKERDSENHFE